jgi:hypothetical protein
MVWGLSTLWDCVDERTAGCHFENHVFYFSGLSCGREYGMWKLSLREKSNACAVQRATVLHRASSLQFLARTRGCMGG